MYEYIIDYIITIDLYKRNNNIEDLIRIDINKVVLALNVCLNSFAHSKHTKICR